MIHDASHLAEQSFWDLLELSPASPLIASHSNCRRIIGEGDRHLTDEMIAQGGRSDEHHDSEQSDPQAAPAQRAPRGRRCATPRL